MARSAGDSAEGPFVARLPQSIQSPVTRAAAAVVVALALFATAMILSRLLGRILGVFVPIGGAGSLSGLFVNTAALHIVGFGLPAAVFLVQHRQRWNAYLRLTECTQWTVFYGTAVGLGLMLVTVTATVLFTVLGISPAESASGQASEPLFYLVLFVVSPTIAVPIEELFFRGLLQRRLTDGAHALLGIAVPSLLFASIHSTVTVGSGGELIAFGMFVGFGIVLGGAYHYTENLFVPIIGHVMFNGVQILVRGLELLL